MLSYRNAHRFWSLSCTRIRGKVSFSNHRSSPDLLELDQGNSDSENLNHSELLYGIHPVNAAISAKRRNIHTVYYRRDLVDTNDKIKGILEDCWAGNIPTKAVPRSKINTYIPKDKHHQGIFAKVSRLYFTPLLCTREHIQSLTLNEASNQVWLMLNEIQDPMNFGSILRTAYFLGCNGIFVTNHNNCRLSPVVSKASSGAMELLPIYSVSNIPDLAQILKDLNWDIIGTTALKENLANGAPCQPISSYRMEKSSFILLGNEGQGLSESLMDLCTRALYIESRRNVATIVDSLNVSAASAIILHQLLNKR